MAKLAAYRAKRDFSSTQEPEGAEDSADAFAFVIQKHDASRLHYDLRLELDGVMKSWAVAKGPSLVPGDKRLAVHVEDHPVAYNSFEGTIPKGQYGGGTVQIWDRGRWVPKGDPRRGYAKGHLDFSLEGEKLAGAWHLVRMRKKPREKQEAWLLIKSDDAAARPPEAPDILEEAPRSVVSGRTVEEIAAAPDGAVWQSNRGMAAEGRAEKTPHPPLEGEGRRRSRRGGVRTSPSASTSSRSSSAGHHPTPDLRSDPPPPGEGEGVEVPFPKSIEPCLASPVAGVPSGPLWLHEIKWDGYRLIAFKSGDKVRLATRRGHDWTHRFPAIAEAVAALPVETAVLDGEAVIEGEGGLADFSALQAALSDETGGVAAHAILHAFDLLYLEGRDLRSLPLEDRKRSLVRLVPVGESGALRLGEHLEADGRAMARSAKELGLEGIISKRRDRPYRSGRGDDWVKMKLVDRQEFVVIGFTLAAASRRAVGSVMLGYHENGKLRLAGRAGTGFSGESARAVWAKLDPLARATPPVPARPTAEERRGVTWVEPRLVAEIEFRGWTGDDHLRHAAFKGLREDKAPEEVVRERPKHAAQTAAPEPAATPKSRPGFMRVRRGSAVVAGVELTHPERVLWPEDGVTKQDLAGFYEEIATWLLPHVSERPLSLLRCPAGIAETCFFQKHSWAGLSDNIHRHTIPDGAGEEEVLFVQGIAGVIALVQASVLEIHPWGSTMADVERADRITIDLDPAEDVPFADVMEAAREVRERLLASKLESFVKTTGGKGLHVVVPLTGPAPWPDVKAFAKSVADGMEKDSPRRFIAKASKSARRGLIYVDYLRNGRGATAVAAYSTRARQGAPISVPLAWGELTAKLVPNGLTLRTLPARLRRLKADPWADLATVRQRLPAAGTRGRAKPR